MSRRSRSVGRGRAPATLPPWPLDPPAVTTAATLPTATHDAAPKPATAPTTTAPVATHGRPGDAYFCRHCGATAEGPEPPAGWWRLQRRQPGYTGRVFTTSGLYCSVGCVAADTAATADRAANPRG